MLGKQNRRWGTNLTLGWGAQVLAHEIPQRVLLHVNSKTVIMEVKIRSLRSVWQLTCRGGSARKWMALMRATDTRSFLLHDAALSRRAYGFAMKLLAEAWVKQLMVHILVVVANIQMRALKTEVDKGFMWTAVGHGLVDPKKTRVFRTRMLCLVSWKEVAYGTVKEFGNASGGASGSVVFSFKQPFSLKSDCLAMGESAGKAPCHSKCPMRFQLPSESRRTD